MLSPLAQQMITQQQLENPDGSVAFDPTNSDIFQKQYVQKQTVDQRMNIKSQYYNQVFKPGHILPTMSIEELAEQEVAGALERQAQDEALKKMREEEDPDSEDVLERERIQTSRMDDWKDYNPKGAGNTKRM